ncbi:hypothetical protein SK128_008013 [Halocaridina rubra]|uniref:Uncharacterized protein n=1 Tax=Halocaridina rubra TaxID=373956 RepID=A0AAN8WZ52_HALRR
MSGDGNPKRFCPSPTGSGEWHCIEDVELCDGISQCPNQEDESPTHCLFYNAMKTHLDEITKFIVFKNLS